MKKIELIHSVKQTKAWNTILPEKMVEMMREGAQINSVEWMAKWEKLLENMIERMMVGGAKGGGKSFFICDFVYGMCWLICKLCQIKPRKYPIPVAWFGRYRAVHFEKTTLQTWFKRIPQPYYRMEKQARRIVIGERVCIDYGGLDSQKDISKFNSAEYGFVAIDQAEEVPENLIGELLGSLGRLYINGVRLPSIEVYSANPRQCWLKNDFILKPAANSRFVQFLPKDNEFIDVPSYVKRLERIFRHRPELVAAYVHGSWDAVDDPDQVIRASDIANAKTIKVPGRKVRFIVIDPAYMGDDECVLYLFEDARIVKQKIFGKILNPKLVNIGHAWALAEEVDAVVIDADGVGGPTYQDFGAVAGDNYEVIGLRGSAAAQDEEHYYNARAEMYMTAGEKMAEGMIPFDVDEAMDEDDRLVLEGELMTPKYDFRGGRILVEPKDEIKQRLGKSPGRADTAVMGWYVQDRITKRRDQREKEGRARKRTVRTRSAMAR